MKKLSIFILVLISPILICADTYMIGDFNDWKIPSNESINGAIKFDDHYDPTGVKTEVCDFPAGTHRFLFVEVDREYRICYVVSAYCPDFFLTDPSGDNDWPIEWECTKEDHFHSTRKDYISLSISKCIYKTENISEAKPFILKDWIGGKITISYYNNKFVSFFSEDAPNYQPITEDHFVYAIVQVDDKDPIILDTVYRRKDGFETYTSLKGKKFSILFSTEKSLNPSPENSWGNSKSQKFDIIVSEKEKITKLHAELVRQGEPYIIETNKPGYLNILPCWTSNETAIQFYEYDVPQLSAEINCDGITRSEPVTYNSTSGFSDPISITGKDVSVIFKTLNPDDPVRYYGVEDCDNYKLRTSDIPKDNNSIKVEITGNVPYSANFKDIGTLTVEISQIYGYALISYSGEIISDHTGITEIMKDPTYAPDISNDETYFDLSGKPGKNPGNGIFLKRKGSSFEKIVL